MNRRRLFAVIRKEVIQILRDRRTLISVITLPIVQLMLYGYLSNDITHIATAVFDESHTLESRTLLNAFTNTTYVDLDYYTSTFDQVRRLIDGGQAKIGIWIPPDYASRLRSGRTAQVEVIVDASEPTSARTVLGIASEIGQELSTQLVIQQTQRLTGGAPSRAADRRAGARLVQPDPRERQFPRAGHDRDRADVCHDLPGDHRDRARARAGDDGAVGRDADHARWS